MAEAGGVTPAGTGTAPAASAGAGPVAVGAGAGAGSGAGTGEAERLLGEIRRGTRELARARGDWERPGGGTWNRPPGGGAGAGGGKARRPLNDPDYRAYKEYKLREQRFAAAGGGTPGEAGGGRRVRSEAERKREAEAARAAFLKSRGMGP